ncbi:hypothetical protein PV326_001311 [Microctonus aethiopoides]|uniref:MoaB/Mog domain-containing protein n=1 Tax=Microctonus aethiopoides TaxID=144406 RepID=A0AA39F0T8_9HYME|nr:hypothetical protein PV326_001311 [Microctonus aethiopoides]KAK0158473.1 hypothetical protein PV328_009470 [Microctonus aethiopoides]
MDTITFGILTISDTRAKDKAEDKSGEELIQLVTNRNDEIGKILRGKILKRAIIPDNETDIMKTLQEWADNLEVNVILTTGGTGFSQRDVTPEATKKIIDKEAPGISLRMLTASLTITPLAMLSRAVCGIRGKTLIINLPGSPKAVRECLNAIAIAIPHAVDLILDNKSEITNVHTKIQDSSVHNHSCTHRNKNNSNVSLDLKDIANRLRESPYPMISMKDVANILNSYNWSGENEFVDLWKCRGRILADDIYARCDLPPFRASIKDGYAVIASDSIGKRLVHGGLEAGHMPGKIKLRSGYCVRVNTGAPIPDEATAVVQVEDTKLLKKHSDGREEMEIEILVEPKEGQDIRPIGSDIKEGTLILQRHTRIGAVEMGILAACGHTKVQVTKLPTIGVLSTGNELQQAGEEPKPGHIYDSNKITLMMLLQEYGYNSTDIGIAIDDEDVMINTIRDAIQHVDILITTGSVSMGDRDMLKPILKQIFNATIHFGRVNMKPGKPTTFATFEFNGVTKYFLCLPGNPVSATVTAHLFVIPLLHRLSGNNVKPTIVQARLTCSYKLDPRPEYARVILEWTSDAAIPLAHSTGNQISSKLTSCKSANALLMLPGANAERSEMKEGDIVQAMLIGAYL